MITKKNILIIEDDEFVRMFLNNELKERYNTVTASTVSEAMQALKGTVFDLIVLDIMLSDGDGFTFLKNIKKRSSSYKEVPVVILSNFDDERDVKRGLHHGAVEFLVKADHVPAEIAEKIDALLQS